MSLRLQEEVAAPLLQGYFGGLKQDEPLLGFKAGQQGREGRF
jgi:hypothetical protein